MKKENVPKCAEMQGGLLAGEFGMIAGVTIQLEVQVKAVKLSTKDLTPFPFSLSSPPCL